MFSFPHSRSLLEFPRNEYLSVELDAFWVEICSLSVNARSFEDYGYSIHGDFRIKVDRKGNIILQVYYITVITLFFEYYNWMERLG